MEDDCKEYVPLSPESTPLETSPPEKISFVSMMEEASETPPIKAKRHRSSQVINPPVSSEPVGSQLMQETLQDTMSPGDKTVPMSETLDRDKDWEDLTLSLNREIAGTYNPENARNRIDVLKKTHKKELTKLNSSGASPSSWPLFKLCDGLWGKTPKASGIAGAFDSDSRATSSTAPSMEVHIDIDNVEDGNSTQNPQVGPSSSEVELEGVFGKKVKQSSKSSLGAFTRTVGLQLQGLSEAITKAEENKLSVFQRIEMARMEHELKMQQNNLNMQLEIAKLYGSRRQD
ncbi:hypothetical protein L7F22_016858 [Adiantum nelumboides]|nr:hypothetical protein [Adiantum nelumboides]